MNGFAALTRAEVAGGAAPRTPRDISAKKKGRGGADIPAATRHRRCHA